MCPGHQRLELHGVGLPVVGVGDVLDGLADELVGVAAEDGRVGAVDPHQVPVGQSQAHADGGVLEGAAKAGLGLEVGGLRMAQQAPHPGHDLAHEHAARHDEERRAEPHGPQRRRGGLEQRQRVGGGEEGSEADKVQRGWPSPSHTKTTRKNVP